MKITANTRSFRAAWKTVASVVPSRSPKPVLMCVRFVADADGSTLAATDLEIGVTLGVPGVKVDRPGVVLLPGKLFGDILAALGDDDEFTLDVDDDGAARITADDSHWNLPTESPDLYPAIPAYPAKTDISVLAGDLTRAIRRTIGAIDPLSTRYALGGCQVIQVKDTLSLVGCDGKRLHTQDVPASCEPATANRVLSEKFMQLAQRSLRDDAAPVDLAINDQASFLTSGQIAIYGRLVEGRYPRWQDIIPASPRYRIEMSTSLLADVIRRARVMTTDLSKGIDFTFSPGRLELSSKSSDRGKALASIAIESDASQCVTCHHQYISDVLTAIDDNAALTWEFTDAKSPVVIKVDGFRSFVMPMTRGDE